MRRLKTLIATLALTASLAGVAVSAPALDAQGKCRDGGRFVTASMCKPAPAAAMAPASSSRTTTMSTGGAPHCSKGKPCGHSCIAMDKVCHK